MGLEHGNQAKNGDSNLDLIQREIWGMRYSVREYETRREDKGV